MRYYGRGATGNRRLGEHEVALLYDRRGRWSVDRDEILQSEVNRWPYPTNAALGYMYAFARPLVPTDDAIDKAGASDDEILTFLKRAARAETGTGGYRPTLSEAVYVARQGTSWSISTSSDLSKTDADPES